MLSASDVETYRACPLRYKFARVLRIPREPTLNQRFGILVHQVLERFHGSGSGGPDDILRLLDAGWRRGGFTDSDEERQLREKARVALLRYHDRLERGRRRAALVRALVQLPARPPPDPRPRRPRRRAGRRRLRADRLQDGRPQARRAAARRRPARALRGRRARGLAARGDRAHLLVRARRRPRAARAPTTARATWIEDVVEEVGAGILAQGFEPTPSHAVCAMCEYRIACPAAER